MVYKGAIISQRSDFIGTQGYTGYTVKVKLSLCFSTMSQRHRVRVQIKLQAFLTSALDEGE
jgi:hypothetical protein